MSNYLTVALFFVSFVLAAGGVSQAATTPSSAAEKQPVSSRLSTERVREIAAARVVANGFDVKASDPWSIALQVDEKGYTWAAHLLLPGGWSPFLVHVDDATGNAEFLTPIIRGQQNLPEGGDWLAKIADALARTHFPIELETLMRTSHFAGVRAEGGGSTSNRGLYLEYTIRDQNDAPARFEIRCYYRAGEKPSDPKIVTAAELAYVDAKLNRYRLVPSSN